MPTFTAADRLDFATGITYRTCTRCGYEGSLTPENFYHRANGWTDRRCQTCRRLVDATNRAARRAGNGTRGGRKFGVEIEFIGGRYDLEREMIARGLRVYNAGYTHRVMASWKIVTDASVNGGYELVSPPLKGAAGIADLKKACEALHAAGARINSACGLHVHHEVRDLDTGAFGRLFRLWSANQRNTDMLVAASRRNTQWARPLRADEVELAEALPSMDENTVRRHFSYADRYRSLNVAAFARYGTVEVRQHQGTLNFTKIAAWIAYGQALIALAKSGSTDAAADPFALIDQLAAHGLAAAQATYLKGRAAHFSGRPVAA